MKRANRNKKYCAFLEKLCLGEDCKIYHASFDRCAVDLLANNLYFHKTALVDLMEMNKKLLGMLERIVIKLEANEKK